MRRRVLRSVPCSSGLRLPRQWHRVAQSRRWGWRSLKHDNPKDSLTKFSTTPSLPTGWIESLIPLMGYHDKSLLGSDQSVDPGFEEEKKEEEILLHRKQTAKSISLCWSSCSQIWGFFILQLILLAISVPVLLRWRNFSVEQRVESLFLTSYRRSKYMYVDEKLTPPEVPAQDAVQHEERYFDKYGHLTSMFSKPPGPLLDRAWHELLKGARRPILFNGQTMLSPFLLGMNIRVSGEYLIAHNVTSVRLLDGSGYIGQLGFYHELHCLVKKRNETRCQIRNADFSNRRNWSTGFIQITTTLICQPMNVQRSNLT